MKSWTALNTKHLFTQQSESKWSKKLQNKETMYKIIT